MAVLVSWWERYLIIPPLTIRNTYLGKDPISNSKFSKNNSLKALHCSIIVCEMSKFYNGGESMWLVMADSHDNLENLEKAVRIAEERRASVIFHCGDIVSPFAARILAGFSGELYVVFGNNDGEVLGLKSILGDAIRKGPYEVVVSGKKVMLMHEPISFNRLKDLDYVFYGHTHEFDIFEEEKPFILNPGESCGYLSDNATCVLLDEETGEFELVEL